MVVSIKFGSSMVPYSKYEYLLDDPCIIFAVFIAINYH